MLFAVTCSTLLIPKWRDYTVSPERLGGIQPLLLIERLSDAGGQHRRSLDYRLLYKNRSHFVCVESSVSNRQQSSTGLNQETVTYCTAPVKCLNVQAVTLPASYLRMSEGIHALTLFVLLHLTGWPRYLKFWLSFGPWANSCPLMFLLFLC